MLPIILLSCFMSSDSLSDHLITNHSDELRFKVMRHHDLLDDLIRILNKIKRFIDQEDDQ
ncbi:MAG: hypothetical protein CMF42_00895 [Legionellales bacterium]|nr:hypothetical protein [Legionellales bacterium]